MNVLPLPHGPSEPLACPWWHGSLHETVHDFAQVLSFAKVCVELVFPLASMRARILGTLSNVCLEKRTMLKVRIATRFRSRIANTQIMLVRRGIFLRLVDGVDFHGRDSFGFLRSSLTK